MLPSAGMTDSVTTIYLATACEPTERSLHGPEEQHSRVVHLPLADAVAMVERGEITDGKSVAGILLAARRLGQGDA
jgi:ADP-ribose pyrophosphatase